MKEFELPLRLVKAVEPIDVIPYINNGGCGVVAHAIGKELLLAGLKVNIVSIGDTKWKRPEKANEIIDEIKNSGIEFNAPNLHRKGIDINHIMVEVFFKGNTWYVDSTGVYGTPPTHGKIIQARMSVNDCGILASSHKGWNRSFNRDFMPKIYRLAKKNIGKLFKPKQETFINKLIAKVS